jgi:hypothetical protein
MAAASERIMMHRNFFKYLAVLLFSGLLVLGGWPPITQAQTPVDVYFFHSETCPHCREQMPLMVDIDQYDPDVTVHIIEVGEAPQVWADFRAERGISSGAVPRTFVGDMTFIGYDSSDGPLEYTEAYEGFIGYRNQIITAITQLVGHELQLSPAAQGEDPWRFPWYVLGLPVLYLGSFPLLRRRLASDNARRFWWGGLAATAIVTLFLLVSLTPDAMIKTFAQQLPFPLFVSVIALADGFNPCAFTVLIILLSLLTHTQRRRDMALVGGTFVITSAVMYFLFIMVMIAVGSVLLQQYGSIFLLVLGAVIAIAGLINLKDYFWFKQGISLSLSQAEQRTITQKAGRIVRRLNEAGNQRLKLLAALGSTVLLAVFVNVVELGCTAILPVVYMTTLVNYCDTQAIGGMACYVPWTGLYAGLYVVPLGLILANFIYSFHSARLTETQGRNLKLVGGLFMVFFGLVMMFQPNLLVFG